jgi:tetratricopeptide (TPR) repeat protein
MEALSLVQRAGDQADEATIALMLGTVYRSVPGLRNLDQAERWYRHSLGCARDDRVGQAKALHGLGNIAFERFQEARAASAAKPVLLEYLNAALADYRQALDLTPASDAQTLAGIHGQIGNAYYEAGYTRQALHHYQQAIHHQEARGDTYSAGMTRYNMALLLQADDIPSDALLYARAALHDFQRTGPGATQIAAETRDLIADLEQQMTETT